MWRGEAAGRVSHRAGLVVIVLAVLSVPLVVVFGRAAIGVTLGLAIPALALAGGFRPGALSRPALTALALMAMVMVGWLPSLAVSIDPLVSLGTWARTGATVGLAVLLGLFIVRHDTTRLAPRLFIIAMLVALAIAVLVMTIWPELMSFRSTKRIDARFKASASAVACAVPVLVLAGWGLSRRWRLAVGAACVLALAVIHLTHSRSALAGLLAGAMVVLVAVGMRRFGVRIVLALPVVAAAVALWVPFEVPERSYGDYSLRLPLWMLDHHRQIIWQFTFDRFLERPWLGWGINAINQVPGANAMIPGINFEFIPSHPHNWVVEVLSETGVAGFLPVLAVVLGVGLAAAVRWHRTGQPAVLAWLALWVIYWVSGLSNFSFWSSWWQASVAILAVLVLAFAAPATSHDRRR